MNLVIDQLNRWGTQAAATAWPLFWQSSLLIGLMLVLEMLLGRKVRPGIRYALWLVVLAKLALPPTLALPTGVAWWVRPAARTASVYRAVVTYGPATLAADSKPAGLPPVPPSQLSLAGSVLAASAAVSLGLLGFSLWRWQRIARRVATGNTGRLPLPLIRVLDEARQTAGVRRSVPLRLVPDPMSPALFGLLRPVLLLPEALARELSATQLRSVLLHELMHLRRCDIWINCAQALLQIVYWWHPLVWLANSRVRRAREEAVDEAVMLALRDEAGSYASTLLEVARLGLARPLASLGLVGILESRRALRQRIERLVEFRPPRARLRILPLLCGLTFGALALPMGQAPARDAQSDEPGAARQRSPAQPSEPRHALETSPLYSRLIKLDRTRFESLVRSIVEQPAAGPQKDTPLPIREFLASLKVELTPPKAAFWNEREGTLFVRASLQDLETIESAVQPFQVPPPQLHIKAQFVELPEAVAAAFWTAHPPAKHPRDAEAQSVEITYEERQSLMDAWQRSSGTELLGQSSVVTLSGRQAEIQVMEPMSIATFTNSPQPHWVTNQVQLGPVFDVLPRLSTDQLKVNLTLTASVKKFLGYSQPGDQSAPEPRFERQTLPATATVWDGCTLVIGGTGAAAGSAEKRTRLLVLVTPTAIDPVGNRIHTEADVVRARQTGVWEGDFPPIPLR